MKCDQPNCKVVCPKHLCPGKDCAACKTECTKPVCKMQCKGDDQPCQNVCAQPRCAWVCKEPKECPKPKCSMKCEKPRDCLDNSRMVTQLPPLEPGETEVVAFHTAKKQAGAPSPAAAGAPASAQLLQKHTKSGSIRVDIATMAQDRSLQRGQVDLKLASAYAVESAYPSWTRTVKKQDGHVTERGASCDSGNFRCQGNSAWCDEQRDVVCSQPAAPEVSQEESAQNEEAADEEEAAQGELQGSEPVEVESSAEVQESSTDAAAAEAPEESQNKETDTDDASAFTQLRSSKQAHLRA